MITFTTAVDISDAMRFEACYDPPLRIRSQARKLQLLESGIAAYLFVDGNLGAGNGASGSFTTPTGQTVTVTNGIVTNIF